MRFFLLCTLLFAPLIAQAQTDPIDADRKITWTSAGAGAIPARETLCDTIAPYTGTAATINTAITSCSAGETVFLSAGTFNLSTGILFSGKDNVTVRGAGPDATFLVFSGVTACGGPVALFCVIATGKPDPDSPPHTANWTAGYSKDDTSITLDSTTGLLVGSLLVLDQLNDPSPDTNEIYVHLEVAVTCVQCSSPGRSGRSQNQIVTVTSINGSTVGISPGLRMPNWRTGQTPGAWWGTSLPITGVGIENLSVDGSGVAGDNNILYYYATNSWVKNVRSITPQQHHIRFFVDAHQTIRDSYFYGTQAAESESYGTNQFISADHLVENNIFQRIASPMMNESVVGSVYAYNFSIFNLFGDFTFAQASSYQHAPNNVYILWEGNEGFGINEDNTHGPAYFITAFRNRWIGFETGNEQQTVPIYLYSFNRYTNAIGNVLGIDSYHTQYESLSGGSSLNCNQSCFALGWGSNCDPGGTPPFPIDDDLVHTTIMRWGNYDVANDAVRFVAAEVPSGISPFPNAVPGDQTLIDSYYLAGRPSFFDTQGGSIPWPPIGPDVTGGDLPDIGGHAYRIPAHECYTDVMSGPADGSGAVLTFNADDCYEGGAGNVGVSGSVKFSGAVKFQ